MIGALLLASVLGSALATDPPAWMTVQCLVPEQGGLVVTMDNAALDTASSLTYAGTPYLLDFTDAAYITAGTTCAASGWTLDFSSLTYTAQNKPDCADFSTVANTNYQFRVYVPERSDGIITSNDLVYIIQCDPDKAYDNTIVTTTGQTVDSATTATVSVGGAGVLAVTISVTADNEVALSGNVNLGDALEFHTEITGGDTTWYNNLVVRTLQANPQGDTSVVLDIIEENCPATDIGNLFTFTNYDQTTAATKRTLDFVAFRFPQQAAVEFSANVTVCSTANNVPCTHTCSKRKRRDTPEDSLVAPPDAQTADAQLQVTFQVTSMGEVTDLKVVEEEKQPGGKAADASQVCLSTGQTIGLGLLVLVLLVISCTVLVIGIVMIRRRRSEAAKGCSNGGYQ